MEEKTSVAEVLIESQKKILPVMYRSHRYLVYHMYTNIMILYMWMFWVLLFIWWIGLPLPLFSIATLIIILPLLVTPFLYKQMKQRFPLITEAKRVLDDAKRTLHDDKMAVGLSSYVSLVFRITQKSEGDEDHEIDDIERLRNSLKKLRQSAITEIIFQGFLLILILTNFLLPEILLLLESGGILAVIMNPVFMLLSFLLVFMGFRWFLYIRWHLLARKWTRLYEGFQSWGQELERLAFSSDDKGGQ